MKTDDQVQMDVMEELKWQSLLHSAEIGVAVKNGIVTLSGTVDSFNKKRAAENTAQNVSGVKAVAGNIEVRISTLGKRTDAEIAQGVINALQWHASVPHEKIRVKVDQGRVTLEGEVEWEFQRRAASGAVESLAGVVAITDNILVAPAIQPAEVKKLIKAAFHRSATIDSDKINISASDGKVVLTGKVRSFAEKKDAEHAAWQTPGVNKVINKLEIDVKVFAL